MWASEAKDSHPVREARYTHPRYRVKRDVSENAREQAKLLKRLNRIRGQMEALHRALEQDKGSTAVLQQATACRGALDGFIAEVIEDHIREHVVKPKNRAQASEAAEELIGIVHSYLT